MRDVIQGLIEAESEARRIVQAARAEADRLVADARQRARDLAAQAREAVRADAAQTLATVAEAAQQEKQRRLAEAALEIRSRVRLDEATRRRLADALVRCLCGHS